MKAESVIIFGGSRGIGRGVADLFLSNGFEVTIVARNHHQLEETTKALSRKGEVHGHVADLSVYEEVKEAVDFHLEKYGSMEAVVNTVALQAPIGPVWENDPFAWNKTILINLVGSFYLCHAALRLMRKAKYGTIILFSGGGAANARPFFSAYATSKTGVLRLVETIQEEIQEQNTANPECGIRIYAVAPGGVRTQMTEEILANKERAGFTAYSEALKTKESGGVPPEKAAELCLFLTQKRPKCLAGRLIHVNEPYQEYVKEFEGLEMGDRGLLRRQGFKTGLNR
jgi:NAD(P)-dependent dehydrogenase (short-subunit alcohol dehydrogenase family)